MVKFYDPQAIAISFAGFTLQGFFSDVFIKAVPMSPSFLDEVGVDGEVSRSKTSDRRVRVTISLMQTSESNALLSNQHLLDLQAPNGAGVAQFRMNDLQGGTFIQGDQAWIEKWPETDMGKMGKAREWSIMIGNCTQFQGGN